MKALEHCGPKAAPAVSFLIRNLEQHFVSSHWYTPPDEAAAIFRALQAVGSAAKEAAPVIKKYTELKDAGRWTPEELAQVKKAAAAALAAVTGQGGAAAVPAANAAPSSAKEGEKMK
jgi:hypothetical protein